MTRSKVATSRPANGGSLLRSGAARVTKKATGTAPVRAGLSQRADPNASHGRSTLLSKKVLQKAQPVAPAPAKKAVAAAPRSPAERILADRELVDQLFLGKAPVKEEVVKVEAPPVKKEVAVIASKDSIMQQVEDVTNGLEEMKRVRELIASVRNTHQTLSPTSVPPSSLKSISHMRAELKTAPTSLPSASRRTWQKATTHTISHTHLDPPAVYYKPSC